MVVDQESIMNIMGGMENTVGVRLHNHRKKLRQRFDIRKKLGQGTYGKVQLGINKETGQEVAIKTIRKCKIETEADLIRIRREIQIMSSVQHPNIIHIYEVFENREKIVLVMEYAAGGELYDYLNKRKVLTENEARRIFRQIATAVYYCHKHKICHRDLKLENILLDEDGNAKIADFGLSNVFGGTRLMETYCGSPLYASPEIVQGIPYRGPEVDCWSLGVLLYTLVYGAMPFDGSHFKRLVKQISEADYFEPKSPSPASPLIGSMLCRSPKKRYDIVRICKHWWVNEGHDEKCLDIAEHLASQTPVRLDLLLSLAPPVTAENVVVTKDMETDDGGVAAALNDGPVRSHSVDSIITVDQKDQMDFLLDRRRRRPTTTTDNHIGSGAKRELTSGALAEDAQGAKKKIRHSAGKKSASRPEKHPDDEEEEVPVEGEPLQRSESKEETLAAAAALAAEAAAATPTAELKPPAPQPPATTPSEGSENSSPSEPSVEEMKGDVNGDVQAGASGVVSITSSSTAPPAAFSGVDKPPEGAVPQSEPPGTPSLAKTSEAAGDASADSQSTGTEDAAVPPTRNTERRRSKIFETAEKFNNLAESKTAPEKNRKVFIPGVKVSDAKAAFERRSSLTPSLDKKPAPATPTTPPTPTPAAPSTPPAPQTPASAPQEAEVAPPEASAPEVDPEQAKREQENRKKVKDAVDIIGRKLSLKKKVSPLAVNLDGTSSAAATPGTPGTPGSPSSVDPVTGMKTVRVQVAPNDVRLATIQVSTPQATKYQSEPPLANREATATSVADEPRKSSKMEITLKSATLPRRKTSQGGEPVTTPAPLPAQPPIGDLSRPAPRRASVGQPVPSYRSEVEHMVGGIDHPNRPRHQRSEVSFPVAAAGSATRIYPSTVRSASLEPESKLRARPREHIIPIRLEEDVRAAAGTQPAKPPVPPTTSASSASTTASTSAHLPYQRSLSARSTSLSRQSTQDSDTDSTVSASGGEPIRKSQREYIIPIAVEGGGYVTPRASSLEPGEDWSRTSSHSLSRSRLSRPKRMSSLFSESDDERESLNSEDRSRGGMDFHRLRSSRPSRRTIEHTDSLSSAEEEDDDEGFEILTAENLFSSLLSRVRSLTQRLNVEDGGRPGFPASRLLNQLHASRAGSPFWTGSVFNRAPLEPLSRSGGGVTTVRTVTTTTTRVTEATRTLSQDSDPSGPTPWRRSVSRDTSDTESVSSGTLPRGRRADASNSGEYSDAVPYSYSPSLSECLSAPSTRRSSRDLTSSRRYSSGYSSARRAARALEEELSQPSTSSAYNRRLGRTLSMRSTLDTQEKELPPLPYVSKRLSGFTSMGLRNSTDGMTMSCPASTFSSREDSVRSPSLLRSTSLSREERPASDRLIHERPALDKYLSDRRASAGIASERITDRLASDRLSCDKLGLDRSGTERTLTERPTLERFLSERPITESSTLGRSTKGRRISRFLRPDFYDTPRESSIYAKERDLQKAAKTDREPPSSNRYSQSLESRIESTIRSLRESSLGPREMDGVPTESSLLRRAVSVSDFTPKTVKTATTNEIAPQKRMSSYKKYTGTTSDTSLLLDQPKELQRELTLINHSTAEPSPSATPTVSSVKKRKTLSAKSLSGTKKQTGLSKPLDVTKTSDSRSNGVNIPLKDPTENKTDEPAISTDDSLPSKITLTGLIEQQPSIQDKPSIQAATVKLKGTSSDLSDVKATTTNVSSSKAEDSTSDFPSVATSVHSETKVTGTSDQPVTTTAKDRSLETSESSSCLPSSSNKAPPSGKVAKETPDSSTESPKKVRSMSKVTDFSGSSLPKVPSLTKLSKSVADSGSKLRLSGTSTETNTTPGLSKSRSISKTSGSMTDVSRISPTKVRTATKVGSSTSNAEGTTSPTKLRSSIKPASSSSDIANSLKKVSSATKLNRSTADSTRPSSTLTKSAVTSSSSDIANTLNKVASATKLNRSTADSVRGSSTLSKTTVSGSSSDIANTPTADSTVTKTAVTSNSSETATTLNKVPSATKLNRSTTDSTRTSSTLTRSAVTSSSSDIASSLNRVPSATRLNRSTADTARGSSTLPKTSVDGSSSDIANTLKRVPSITKLSRSTADGARTSSLTKSSVSGSSSDVAATLSKVSSATKLNRSAGDSTRSSSALTKTAAGSSSSDVTITLRKVPSASKVVKSTTDDTSTSSATITKNAVSGSSSDIVNSLSKVSSATKLNRSAGDNTRSSSALMKTAAGSSSSDVTITLRKVPSASKVVKSTTEDTSPSSATITKNTVSGSSSDIVNSLSKVPSATKVNRNKNENTRTSSMAKTSVGGSSSDIANTLNKVPSASKINRMATESTRRSSIVSKTALSGSSSDVANILSKVPSATKVNKSIPDTPRTSSSLTKTSVIGSSSDITLPSNKVPSTTKPVPSTSTGDSVRASSTATKPPGSETFPTGSSTSTSPEATKKVVRPASSLLLSGSSERISTTGSPTPRRNSIKTSHRKSDNDAKTNGTVKIRSSTESPSTSPTKRVLVSLSPIPRRKSPPMPGQSSPRPARRRNSVSQPPSSKRSSSQSRRGRSSSSVEPDDIPVISLKDVERRHRAMLLDRWSQSLQSLHLEREKAKAEAEAKAEAKPESKSEPKVEVKIEHETETNESPKCEAKVDILKGKIPRRNGSQSVLGETLAKPQSIMPPKIPSSSVDNRPKTLSLKVNLSCRSDDIMSPVESESPHSALTSPVSEDTESVSERIRRKSFYSRFNDVKKKKRSASSSLLPSYNLTPRTHYPTEYTRSLSCGISGADRGRPFLLNGSSDEPATRPKRKERSPSWERSNMEIQNDLLFHNLGLHRFDPNNLSTDKHTLFGMLSPTSEVAGSLLGGSSSSSNIAKSDSGDGATCSKKGGSSRASSESEADVVVTLPPPKPSANKT